MDTKTIQIGLVENILDYLLEAAEHAEKGTPRDWKYALLHTVSAIELLIKARLQEEHWSLIFADLDKATEAALKSGDFNSVDFKSAIKRLTDIVGVALDRDTNAKLEGLRKYRNQVQHYAINTDKATILPLVAFGYNFALNFIRNYLQNVDESEVSDLISRVAQKLSGFKEFINARMSQLTHELEKAYALIGCPRCWQKTMVLGDGNPRCLFCGTKPEPQELANELFTVDGSDECPECGGVCVQLPDDWPYTTWQCLSCGNAGDYERCSKCNHLISGHPCPGGHCQDCWEYILKKNV